MKCEDCELLLAAAETGPAVEDHLRDCASCRALAEDLRANEAALAELRTEAFPPIAIRLPRRRWLYGSVVAAAAAVLAFAILMPRTQPLPPAPKDSASGSQIKVKMLTSDPQVVIYWLIDN